MRVEYTLIKDISQSNMEFETKESNLAGTRSIPVKNPLIKDTPYSVSSTTVKKALCSLESELEKIKQDAKNIDVELIQKNMSVLSNCVSEEQQRIFDEEGYSYNDTDVETIVTVMDKIKLELAKAGQDISIFGDDLSLEQLEDMTGSIQYALQMAEDLHQCEKGEIAYIVANQIEPTIENLYLAQHSGSMQRPAENPEYLQEEVIQGQIAEIISASGLEVDKTTMGYGELLLQYDIPLTVDNIRYVHQLSQLQLPLENQQSEAAVKEAVLEGKRPTEAYLLHGFSLKDRARQAVETVQKNQEDTLACLIEKGMCLTIQNIQRFEGQSVIGMQVSEQNQAAFIRAKRQMEEIRLSMTMQANYQLLKRGISIETIELEQVIEELKELENKLQVSVLEKQGMTAEGVQSDLYRDTLYKTEQLKSTPVYLLGEYKLHQVSLSQMHESGIKMQRAFEEAGEAYDTMMTMPQEDLGDSLEKAFGNVDSILEDMNLETSEQNRRAVRILAYNQMEITQENLLEVKAADEKVQNLFGNLTPKVVLELIREGVNPLEENVDSLNQKAEAIGKQQDFQTAEKYSSFLWKLEQNGNITAEEKKSYIGIFRLLRQIEKTDGAVIGSLINQGSDLSMKNLLSAVRSRNHAGMDVTVDDNFAYMKQGNKKDSSISQQIEAAFQTDCAKDVFRNLTISSLQECGQQEDIWEMTPEQLLSYVRQRQMEENYTEYQKEILQQAREVQGVPIQLLGEYELPVSVNNILAVDKMLHDRNTVFQNLFQEVEDIGEGLQEAKEILLKRFAEAVKTPEDMAKAQQALAETAERVMDNMLDRPDMSSVDIRELKIQYSQIQLNTKMSQEENYAIPILVADEMTNVQLKIVRGKKQQGMVEIFLDNEKLGKIMAQLQLAQNRKSGLVLAEKQETIEGLKKLQEKWQNLLQENKEEQVHIEFIQQDNLGPESILSRKDNAKALHLDTEEYKVQTRKLYDIAKIFLETLKEVQIDEN